MSRAAELARGSVLKIRASHKGQENEIVDSSVLDCWLIVRDEAGDDGGVSNVSFVGCEDLNSSARL